MAQNEIPKAGEIYKHFKDKLYQIITVAEHTETQEKLVIYQALYGDFSIYARPLSMFISEVDHEKYPNVIQKYRFVKVKFVTRVEEVVPEEEEKKEEVLSKRSTESEIAEANPTSKAGLKRETEMVNEIEVKSEAGNLHEEKYSRHLRKQYSAEELFYQFLNADTYKEKLEIFLNMREKADDRILTNIAVSMDLVVEDDDLEERYTMIRQNLETYAKFECNRLR